MRNDQVRRFGFLWRHRAAWVAGAAAACLTGLLLPETVTWALGAQTVANRMPLFELDPSWPKPLPGNWLYGLHLGVAVDSEDHVWFLHGPFGTDGTVLAEGAATQRGPAPPLLEFDRDGRVLQAWGGPGLGYNWPQAGSAKIPYPLPGMGGWAEHDVFVDHEDNIWIAGNGHVVLKFNHTGRFQLQLGELWKTAGSNDPKLLGNPTSGTVDPSTNEVFIADGYANRRIIVFDARTGTYRRHWGAYGKRPVDGAVERFDPNGTPPQQFQPTHCVKIANDGLVYVCDRERNRIQVFRKNGSFLTEAFVAKNTATTGPSGAVSAIAFSADAEQRYVYVADHTNSKIWLLRRSDLFVLGSLDSPGNHGIATDSKGNLYTSGTLDRARVPLGPRRYTFKGVAAVPGDSAARP